MGTLGALFKRAGSAPVRFPRGSFTVSPAGEVVISTLPRSFPPTLMDKISRAVLASMRSANDLDVPLTELTIRFAGLQIRARDLGGGAIIFLKPEQF